MNNNLVMDAISYLDAELLAVNLEKKAELRARAKAKKKMILQWGAIAACIALILCMVPIVNMIFNGSHGDAPVSIRCMQNLIMMLLQREKLWFPTRMTALEML